MKSYKKYVVSAMFAALILLGTSVIQVPSINGYVHIGDSFVYLAACFLPFPFSVIAAGIGAAVADALTPYIAYAPFTFVIKALMAAVFTSKGTKILTKRNVFALFLSAFINVIGYYLTEIVLYPQGSFTATLITSVYTIPGNVVQSITSSVIFLFAAIALDKLKFKGTIDKI